MLPAPSPRPFGRTQPRPRPRPLGAPSGGRSRGSRARSRRPPSLRRPRGPQASIGRRCVAQPPPAHAADPEPLRDYAVGAPDPRSPTHRSTLDVGPADLVDSRPVAVAAPLRSLDDGHTRDGTRRGGRTGGASLAAGRPPLDRPGGAAGRWYAESGRRGRRRRPGATSGPAAHAHGGAIRGPP